MRPVGVGLMSRGPIGVEGVDDHRRELLALDKAAHLGLCQELRALVGTHHVVERARRHLVRGPTVGVKSQGGNTRGVDYALDAGRERRGHQRARALDVGAVHRLGVAHPEPVIRGYVIDRTAARDRGGEARGVLQQPLGDLEIEPGEITAVAVRPTERPHGTPSGDQRARDCGADKSRGPRDQHGLGGSGNHGGCWLVRCPQVATASAG